MFFVGCVTVSDVMGDDGFRQMIAMQQEMMAQQQRSQQLAIRAIAKSGEGGQDGSSSQTSGAKRFTTRGKDPHLKLLFDGHPLPQYILDGLFEKKWPGFSGEEQPGIYLMLNDLNKNNQEALKILYARAPQLFEEAQDSSDPNELLVLKKPGEPLGSWGNAASWGTGLVRAGILANLIAELAGDRNALLDLLNLNKKLRNNEKFKRFLGKQDKSIKKSKSARAARIMISIAQAIALAAGTNWLHNKLIAPAAMRRDLRPVKLEPIFVGADSDGDQSGSLYGAPGAATGGW